MSETGPTGCKGKQMISCSVLLKGSSRVLQLLWPDLKTDPQHNYLTDVLPRAD